MITENQENQYLTTDEVSAILRITKASLARLVKSGKIRHIRPTERKVYFTQKMINEYLGV